MQDVGKLSDGPIYWQLKKTLVGTDSWSSVKCFTSEAVEFVAVFGSFKGMYYTWVVTSSGPNTARDFKVLVVVKRGNNLCEL